MTPYERTVFTGALVFVPACCAAVIYYDATRSSSWLVIIGGELAIAITAIVINQLAFVIPLRRRLMAAVDREDPDAVDAVLADFEVMWPTNKKVLAAVEATHVVALVLRERYDEAVPVARRAVERAPSTKGRPLLMNNLAWALAHTGALDEAVELGEHALASATDKRSRAFTHGTLGAVYALRGDGDRALRHLDEALASGEGWPAADATRQYYRGVALEAKRQPSDAIRAYEAASRTAPGSLFGRKAAARAADLQSSS